MKKKAREEIEEEFHLKTAELQAQIQNERLELSRQKSSINVTRKKMMEERRELDDLVLRERSKYQ